MPAAVLSGFVTGLFAWAGSVLFFRKRIPCVTVTIDAHRNRHAGRDHLHVIVVVTNIGLRKVVAEKCELSARKCTGTEVGDADECHVQPIPPARETLSSGGAGLWTPPKDDVGRLYTLDNGESNTFAFVVSLPTSDEAYICHIQVDYSCAAWYKAVPIIGFHSYSWRRDAMYPMPGASTLPHDHDARDHCENDSEHLRRNESLAEHDEPDGNSTDRIGGHLQRPCDA